MAAHDLSISDEMSNLQGLFEKHSLLIDFIFYLRYISFI